MRECDTHSKARKSLPRGIMRDYWCSATGGLSAVIDITAFLFTIGSFPG